jgi:type IV pilus assembly protein PilE
MKSSMRFNRGVTLIELMVTMSIVGILAAIAVPSYTRYVTRTNRAAARACLSEGAQQMERFYTTAFTYVNAEGGDGSLGLTCETESSLNTRYTITVDTLAQRTFRLVATPIGAQLAGDTQCGVLTLNHLGTRTESGTGTLDQCW